MKRRILSFVLALSLMVCLVPFTAVRSEAAQTWYAPIVQQVMDERIGYEWLEDYDKAQCRGGLQDVDGDGFEELILVFTEGDMSYTYCQVWDLQSGAIVCVLDKEYYGSYGGNSAYFFELEGTNYLVVEATNTGTVGSNTYWDFLDPLNGYTKVFTVTQDVYDKTYSIGGEPATAAQSAQLKAGLEDSNPLAGPYDYGKTFEQLSGAEIYTQLIAYSQNQDMAICEGDELTIRYVLYDSDEIVTDWQMPAFAVSDGSVVKAVDWEASDDGYLLTLQGLSAGEATLTVTDGESKAFVSVNITVRESDAEPYTGTLFDVPSGYPEVFGDSETQTNFYAFNGLYVNQYKCGSLTNGKYPVSFTVYNHSNMYGSVDIYDQNGNWIGAEKIKKFQDPTSIYEVGTNTWFLVKDLVTLNALSYTSSTFSQKTEISVSVPQGGYIVISNNFQESPGTYLYNAVDLLMTGANAVVSLVMNVTQVEQVQDQIIHMMMENEAFTKAFLNEFQKIAQNTIQEMSYDGIAQNVGAVTAHAGEFFESLDLDFWGTVSSVCGIAEDVFLQCTMAEVTFALKSMFALNKFLNVVYQAEEICTSGDEPGILLTSAQAARGEVTVSGIKAAPDSGALPSNAVLQVFRIAPRDTLSIPELGVDTEKYQLYNICYTVKNEEVQPEKAVTIQIPVPQDYDENKCIILHQQEDGSWEQVLSQVENGFLVFRVDHFSLFALVESAIENPFRDVPLGQWYTAPILWAVDNGITNGTTATTFSPEDLCTRAQVVTFLWRTMGSPEPTSTENPFEDVVQGEHTSWYYDAVLWAVENGITNGRDETHFAPDGQCLRSEVVMFLWRAAGKPAGAISENPFADVFTNSWFYDPVLWAVGDGITNGVDDTHFGPDEKCTRAQIVTFLYRYAN